MNVEDLKQKLSAGPNVFKPYHFENFSLFRKYASVEDKRVAVLGCSFGSDCQMMLAAGASHVIGIDLDPRIGHAFRHQQVRYVRASISDLSIIPSNSVDVIYSVAVFEHVFDIQGALSESKRILAPGGIAFIVSSPLWNSAYGHHCKAVIEDLPWIHLCCAPAELAQHLAGRDLTAVGMTPSDLIEYIYKPDGFNRYPSQFYQMCCEQLTEVQLLSNETQQYPESRFSNMEFFEQALGNGFTSTELLTFSHICAFEKQ